MLLILLFTGAITTAATLKGTIYGPDFEILKNVIIDVNSSPKQFYVAKNGEYVFNLPPGDYSIEAKYYIHGRLEYSGKEEITIPEEEGEFILDFILLPSIEEERLFEDYPELEELSLEEDNRGTLLLVVAVVFFLGTFIYLKKRDLIKEIFKSKEELPDDLKDVVKIIAENGGRITQKELRRKLPYSEAKVSLMIADLEDRGFVKKIKRGRGNIIILKRTL